jgi:ATP-dependent Lon protease
LQEELGRPAGQAHDERQTDLAELPDYLKEGLEVHFAREYKDVYKVAFGKG